MKNFLKLIRNYFGEISLVVGTGLFFYNIFNFSFSDSTRGGINIPGLPKLGGRELGNVAYYYTEIGLLLISVSAILIVVGILMIRSKRCP